MVQADIRYVRSLPESNVVEMLDYDVILAERVAALQSKLGPDWSGSEDSPGYKIQEVEALREYVMRQTNNQRFRNSLLPTATGSHLTILAAEHGVVRMDDESDEDLLIRTLNFIQANPVTEKGLRALAKTIGTVNVKDSAIQFAANRQSYTLYALGPEQVDLSPQDKSALQAFMGLPENNILGATPTVGDVTRTPLSIHAILHYDTSLTTEAVLMAAARRAAYAWIDDNHFLGYAIYRDNIQEALKISGVNRVVFTHPANEVYPGSPDNLYAFQKKDADVGVRISVVAL